MIFIITIRIRFIYGLSIVFVTTLKDYVGTEYTLKQCQMAMLYGLNNPGSYPPMSPEANKLNAIFEKITAKYSITTSELNAFNLANVAGVPANKKAPTNCP